MAEELKTADVTAAAKQLSDALVSAVAPDVQKLVIDAGVAALDAALEHVVDNVETVNSLGPVIKLVVKTAANQARAFLHGVKNFPAMAGPPVEALSEEKPHNPDGTPVKPQDS
jgi:hypothetical protein